VKDFKRVEALIEADVDVVIVDTAHGHSKNVMETVREIKKNWDIQVVAGNIATADAARDLIEAGVDAVKVGIGPGAICTTRIVSWGGRSADLGDYECRQRGGAGGSADHCRWRHSPQRRHRQGAGRGGKLRDDGIAVCRAG